MRRSASAYSGFKVSERAARRSGRWRSARRVGLCFLVELAGERRKRAIARAAPPIVIDDGIAQHTVEPRHRGLRTLEGHLLQATREGFLEDVLSHVAMADPPLQEREKGAPILDQRRSQLVPRRQFSYSFAACLVSRLLHSFLPMVAEISVVRARGMGDHANVRAQGVYLLSEEPP